MVNIDLARLCRRLKYEFQTLDYLKQALTHRSVSSDNYERFEFLGDSILSFVIAQELFTLFPHFSEGELSRLRASLVKGEMLAEIARELDLGSFLFLGQGELKSGGFRRESTLADALEALFAAVYLDTGIAASQEVILNLYRSRLDDPRLADSFKDSKTQLQEYLQAAKRPLPHYVLVGVEGGEHDRIFHVMCTIEGIAYEALGQGSSRRKAEQMAAEFMLMKL